MKEYIKLFEGLNSADGYKINDTPFTSTIKQVSGETAINLRCNKPDSSIIIEDGEPRIVSEVTISGTWNPSVSDKSTKVIISGNVVLCGKTDCYSIEFVNSGHLTINAGARLRIWQGGIINQDAESVSGDGYFTIGIDSTTDLCGEFLLHPSVSTNNHPKAKVDVLTYAYGIPSSGTSTDYIWQRLTTPMSVYESISHNYATMQNPPALLPNETRLVTWVEILNEESNKWEGIYYVNTKPFDNYTWSHNAVSGGVTYYFRGKLLSNANGTMSMIANVWHSASNSYLGKISIRKLYEFCVTNNCQLKLQKNLTQNTAITITDDNADDYVLMPMIDTIFIKGNITQLTVSYEDLVWASSFNEEIQQTRGIKSFINEETAVDYIAERIGIHNGNAINIEPQTTPQR